MNQHRKGNSFDAGVPGDPRLHDAINRRTPRGAGVQVTNTHAGVVLAKTKKKKSPDLPPFYPILGCNSDGTFFVTVTDGRIIERALSVGEDEDALLYHECSNRLTSGKKTKFAISVGQSIFVTIYESVYGAIDPGPGGSDISLVINSDSTISTNYIPSIQSGVYYYKLASLITDGGVTKLKMYAGGSNIYHSTGLTADLLVRDCPVYPETIETAPILLRASFVSGKLVSVGETESARPLAATIEQNNLVHCS
jgi:hypothetical protein